MCEYATARSVHSLVWQPPPLDTHPVDCQLEAAVGAPKQDVAVDTDKDEVVSNPAQYLRVVGGVRICALGWHAEPLTSCREVPAAERMSLICAYLAVRSND